MIYRFTIKPQGAGGTPFRSDTLFGHACWTISFTESQTRFDEFLQNAREQKPELIFSDGFPSGFLPCPLFPIATINGADPDDQRKHKKFAKQKWVRRTKAEQLKWQLDISVIEESVDYANFPFERENLHNVIDRMTGTSLAENGLFPTNEIWYTGIWETLDIFIATSWDKDQLNSFLVKMFESGYGRDQSVGLGAVEIAKPAVPETFPSISGCAVSLSRMVPDKSIDLEKSFYELETKYGKVWSGLGSAYPFKKPILQTIPGSVFYGSSIGETGGRVLTNIHDTTSVVENCMGIFYPLPAGVYNE
jgi:CRISPR-associated protein Csm4